MARNANPNERRPAKKTLQIAPPVQSPRRSANTSRQNQQSRPPRGAQAKHVHADAKMMAQSKAEKHNEGEGREPRQNPIEFVEGTVTELKMTTWPKPVELLKWCGIVIVTVAILAFGAMLVDDFVAAPVMYWVSSLNIDSSGDFGVIDIVLLVLLVISGIGTVAGIYMRSGGDTEGLSDTMATRLTGGSGQAQKNLNRITIACVCVFVFCLLAAMVIYPQGTIVVS